MWRQPALWVHVGPNEGPQFRQLGLIVLCCSARHYNDRVSQHESKCSLPNRPYLGSSMLPSIPRRLARPRILLRAVTTLIVVCVSVPSPEHRFFYHCQWRRNS